MRLFAAAELNDAIKDELCMSQKRLQQKGMKGSFVPRQNMHLTLAFIGEYSDAELVREVVDQTDFDGFEIGLDGIGAFGNLWWAGINFGDDRELKAVAKKLRRGLADAGIPFDRKKFSPHITLVRKAQSIDGKIPESVLDGIPQAGMYVDRISLMRSDRGRHGMIYTVL